MSLNHLFVIHSENSITRLVGSVHLGIPHSFASVSACYKHDNKRFRTAAK